MMLHPDDVLLYNEVVTAAKRVAKEYNLPLKGIEPIADPKPENASGYCWRDGMIRVGLRIKVDGVWAEEPLPALDVWDTMAHELAHLKHFNHGTAFQEFEEEMLEAMTNRRKQKVIDKVIKLRAAAESENKLGNIDAAESFAAAINRLMLEHEINQSDLEFGKAQSDEPVVEVHYCPSQHGAKAKKQRIAWQEKLASIVANAHLCRLLVREGSNVVTFVGQSSHATIAEYAYALLLPIAEKVATQEYDKYWLQVKKRDGHTHAASGFRGAWLDAFCTRIRERLEETKQAFLQHEVHSDEARSNALVRLNQSLVKVKAYMDNRFRGGSKYASALNGGRKNHADGRAWGRAAADRMTLGRRGVVGAASPKGFLK